MTDLAANIERFFAYARERQSIYRKRERGESPPWTDDWVMRNIYLCNVFREEDKTTVWFRENVREPWSNLPDKVFAATVLFRWFNRIETGKLLFGTPLFETWRIYLLDGWTPEMAGEWLAKEIDKHPGPHFTGAYMIKADSYMKKTVSVSIAASYVYHDYLHQGQDVRHNTLYGWTCWLKKHHGLGWFMSYEIATDLRWTVLGKHCTDIMTWANVGPGCARGLSRLHYDTYRQGKEFLRDRVKALEAMAWLLGLSRQEEFWPQSETPWEMREVEHELCEFDKIERAKSGSGRIKRVYRYPKGAING